MEQRTNMVFWRANDCDDVRQFMAGRGVLLGGGAAIIRMVLHHDVDDDALEHAVAGFEAFASST